MIKTLALGAMMTLTSINNAPQPMPENIGYDRYYNIDNSVAEKQWEEYLEKKDKESRYIGEFQLTFYTNSVADCGKTDGITASGNIARSNHTIAMDSRFPFGTIVEIEGFGTYTVEDRGGKIRGNIIDIYVDSQEEANQLGRIKNVKVYYAK